MEVNMLIKNFKLISKAMAFYMKPLAHKHHNKMALPNGKSTYPGNSTSIVDWGTCT
jgi:hypothetical protein